MIITVQEALRRVERIRGISADTRAEIPMGWEDTLAELVDGLLVDIFRQCQVCEVGGLTDDHQRELLDAVANLSFNALVKHGQLVAPSRPQLLPAPVRPPRGWRL
ncbi:TPA: hypothetical protein DEB00_00345 [Candidatus Uhrbacteria bacterium]|nr:hypothetical protein [Candidatus Uhrbacteria bacterium]